jgi:hypothetical protein
MNGRFKIYTEKNRFHIPETLRAIGGRATELRFEATDGAYNCEPHALDYPIDNLESLEQEGLENALREGAVAVAEIAALAHEKKVIDMALTAAGSGTDKTWNSSADPVDDIDTAVLSVLKAAKYGSLMGVGCCRRDCWKNFRTPPASQTVSSSAEVAADTNDTLPGQQSLPQVSKPASWFTTPRR